MEELPLAISEKNIEPEDDHLQSLNKMKYRLTDDESTEPPPPVKITTRMPKKNLSQAQIDHLKYARDCKKLKSVGRDNDRQITNTNLDFIYRRLTNIEGQVRSLAGPIQPFDHTYTPATPVLLGKRRAPDTPKDKDPVILEMIEESNAKKKKTEEAERATWVSVVKEYATRGAIIFGAGLAFNLAKRYIQHGTPIRTTQDGDEIGRYYVPHDG